MEEVEFLQIPSLCPVAELTNPVPLLISFEWWPFNLNVTRVLLVAQLVCVFVCVCVCGHVYVVYEDTNLYNDMGMT